MVYDVPIPIILKPSKTGLTLKAQLTHKTTGANVGAQITTGFVEIGGGNYQWSPADVPAGFVGGVKILNASDNSLLAFDSFNAAEFESTVARVQALDNLDAAISDIPDAVGEGTDALTNEVPGTYEAGTAGAALGRISSAKITTISPVSVSGDLSEWTGATNTEKERDLISATRMLSQKSYKGCKTSSTQALPFPRFDIYDDDDYLYDSAAIPKPMEYAAAELAFVLRRDPTLLDDTGLEAFDSISTGDNSITPKARQAGTLPAQVQRFLRGLTKGGAGVIRLMRG